MTSLLNTSGNRLNYKLKERTENTDFNKYKTQVVEERCARTENGAEVRNVSYVTYGNSEFSRDFMP